MSEQNPTEQTPAEKTPEPESAVRDRLDAVAARAGLPEEYVDVAAALFAKTGKEATRENFAVFVDGLKKDKPALFPKRSTAPVVPGAGPAAPAAGSIETEHQRWRALRDAGRTAEAEAFYKRNRSAILRGQ